MIQKILIANRGEIACRVIKTARKLGIQTVALYAEGEEQARHVVQADMAFCVGGPRPAESYLRADKVLEIAKLSGADAIHPGYGFLSENADFAKACTRENIIFIGPPIPAIEAMGDKATSKQLMRKADVPLAPGYDGDNQDLDFLQQEAEKIGFPIILKPSAGGGGKGMRIVENAADFKEAAAACQREALSAFGDAKLLLETYVLQPRHVEVQIFSDQHGTHLHLFDRDCSVQRRHQKVIEEAPAPGLDPDVRARLHQAAVNAAQAVDYCGAGTVEFLLNANGDFYFMEMNTRLQVEHPVTEMVTGQDLVAWQIMVAAGQKLPVAQSDIQVTGASMEARLYAEDPDNDFLPCIGTLAHLSFPTETDEIRIDTGVRQADVISPNFDPMIAKIISYGPDRQAALDLLQQALRETHVAGVTTNRNFLISLTECDDFRTATLETGLIEKNRDSLFAKTGNIQEQALLYATLYSALNAETAGQNSFGCDGLDPTSPWMRADGWRLTDPHRQQEKFILSGQESTSEETEALQTSWQNLGKNQYQIVSPTGSLCVTAILDGDHIRGFSETDTFNSRIVPHAQNDYQQILDIFWGKYHVSVTHILKPDYRQNDEDGGDLRAPMPGRILSIATEAGIDVQKGDVLLTMEAMKMEHTITAPADGHLANYLVNVGDQVEAGEVLVHFEESGAE